MWPNRRMVAASRELTHPDLIEEAHQGGELAGLGIESLLGCVNGIGATGRELGSRQGSGCG